MEKVENLSPEEKLDLITFNLEEVLGKEDIVEKLKTDQPLKIYWGTATTGKPHVGYFVPIFKIADFLQAGCDVTILFADLHAFLDNMKSNWELLQARCEWYQFIIKEMLKLINVPLEKLHFIKGTEYQLSKEYTLDVYKMSALCTADHAAHAGAEVVKQAASPLLSNLLYPILQALDEQHLGCDVQFGGVDQRKIFTFAREMLPRVGYNKRSHLMNSLIPGLGKSGKMSSSEPNSKVDFDDTDAQTKKKIKGAFSIDGQSESNGLLAMLQHFLFKYLKSQGKNFETKRPEKYGGPQSFSNFEEVKEAFEKEELVSGDLKPAVADLLLEFLKPLREACEKNKELNYKAYPESAPKQKPKKGPVAVRPVDISRLDIKIGKIVEIKKHDNADKLYVEKIDLGEETGPRTIVSGLVHHIPIEEMENQFVMVLANLKAAKMVGVESHGMVLCASNEDHSKIELIQPPEGVIGESVTFEGYEQQPDKPFLNPKKKIFQALQPDLKINENGVAMYKNIEFTTKSGVMKCKSITNGTIS